MEVNSNLSAEIIVKEADFMGILSSKAMTQCLDSLIQPSDTLSVYGLSELRIALPSVEPYDC